MSEEKRLSVTFGDFSCEIVGYDDPFSILNKIVSLLATMRDVDWRGESAPRRDSRGVFAARLKSEAEAAGLAVNETGGRFIVSPAEGEAATDDDGEATLTVAPSVFKAESAVAENEPVEATTAALSDAEIDQPAAPTEVSAEVSTEESAPETEAADVAPLEVDEPPLELVAGEEDAEVAAAPEAAEFDDAASTGEDIPETLEPLNLEPLVLHTSQDADAPVPTAEVGSESVADDATSPTEDASESVVPVLETPILEPARFLDGIAGGDRDNVAEAQEAPRYASSLLDLNASQLVEAQAAPVEKTEAVEKSAAAEETSEEAAEKPEAPARPRIVIDRAKSRSHTQQRRQRKAPRVTIEQQRVEPAEAKAASEVEAEAAPTLSLSAADLRAPKAPAVDADTNFLFDDVTDSIEEPLSLTSPVAPREPETRRETPVKEERSSRRLSLGLGIFGRKRAVEPSDEIVADDESAGFARLEEAAHAALPKLDPSTRSLSEGAAAKLFALSDAEDFADDEASPAGFARRVGAQSLQDLLEASAAYVAIVEGKAKFSRRDVMTALAEIELEKDYTSEARIKTFRKLVSSGALVRDDSGLFSISHATRFGYENQLRA